MIPFIIMAVVGTALLVAGIIIKKKFKIAMIIVGAILLTIGGFIVLLSLYFGWAVSVDAPYDYDEEDIDGGEVDDGNICGEDWTTWRSYTGHCEITEDLAVTMSVFDDLTGYAVYDAEYGDRIGSLADIQVTGQEDFVAEDIDGDGVNEIGVLLPEGTVYYRYTDEVWVDGVGGGAFEKVEE